MGGEEVLHHLRNEQRLAAIPVIVITAFGSSHNAIEAVRLGAYDFVMKPFDLEEISLTVERALAHSSLDREVMDLRARIERQNTLGAGRLIGSSARMLDAFKMIGKVAETDTTVLICGESGTGKELVAEAIHNYSRRKDNAFVVVNCAALPENLLEWSCSATNGEPSQALRREKWADSKWPKAGRSFWMKSANCLEISRRSSCESYKTIPSNDWAAPRPRAGTFAFWPQQIVTWMRPCGRDFFAKIFFIASMWSALLSSPAGAPGGYRSPGGTFLAAVQ